ncbi:hypothetical protein [Pontibacter sp. H249]|uniref:hypothetical protein n=1 Tax=Pontibacter sp. H249 TaxID=3133420 RepID=UPI0030BC9486
MKNMFYLKHLLKLVLLLLCTTPSAHALSQTIRGCIVDKKLQEPLDRCSRSYAYNQLCPGCFY